MSQVRRLIIVLTALGAGTVAARDDRVRAAQVPQANPAPQAPPPVIRQRVRARAGVPLPVMVPPGGDPNQNLSSDTITFPTDRKARRSIDAAEDFIKEEAWGEAARLLQSLLDTREDVFIEVKRDNASRWTSLRGEANRLLGSMPLKGREFYELQYGARAKALLADAKGKGDPQLLADVAQRYLHTQAGAEATNLLGTYHLDRGRYVMAALCFERLLNRAETEVPSPLTLFKATLAFRRTGDRANADRAWKLLSRAAREGLTVGGQNVPLARLEKELDAAVPAVQQARADWPMFRGDPSRSAEGNGGAPFLEARWTMPTFKEAASGQRIRESLKLQDEHQQPIIPGSFPIAVTVQTRDGAKALLVYRSFYGIHAINLRTGAEEWNSPSNWSLDRIADDPSKNSQFLQWTQGYLQNNAGLLFENATIGTLSTDNERVYVVDDLPLPPHPQSQPLQQLNWGGQPAFGPLQDAVEHNRLQAYDLVSGKLLWELGAPEQKGELSESYFLGPPLPLGGKLYVLTEKASELRLVCLDAPHGDVAWSQALANVRDRLLIDVGRRVRGVNLAYGDGMLICPTNAGAVLAVDLLTHSLVWAHPYRDEAPAQEQPPIMMRRGGGVWMNQVANQHLRSDWKASAPVVQDGRVVFTAPDANSVYCLNLRDGTLLWKKGREDDLYLGGVFHGKVLLVGRTACRALSLADGKQLWRLDTGLPSGEGIASDSVYYLPLKSAVQSKEPEVCAIDLDKGNIIAHTKSRKKEVPGNLLFYEGDVVSQTPTNVTDYPQLRVRLAQIDQALQKDPRDPVGLTDRGELKLDKGDLLGAVQDLRTALAAKPPADVLPRTRGKLFETLTELFQRDFDASERYLDEYRDMCKVTIPADTSAEDKEKLEQEQHRRQANFLCLLGKGREKQGRLADAFQAYLDFGALAGNGELVTVIDEPAVKARPDVWAQGRIAAMVAHATPEKRRPVEEEIARRWREVRDTSDTESLRKFVTLFGSLFTVGQEARLRLAERLMEENVFLEAEQQLLQARRQDDPQLAARAVEALGRLSVRKGLLEDAAFWYRLLAREYGQTVIRDGKTGAELFNELATDKRFLPYLEDQRTSWSGKIGVKDMHGNFGTVQAATVFEAVGERLPYFENNRLVLHQGPTLKLVDRATHDERWSHKLGGAQPAPFNTFFPGMQNARFSFTHQGHLVVVGVRHEVFGVDPVDQKILWQKSLIGSEAAGEHQFMQGPNGPQLLFAGGYIIRLGQTGPVEPSYVCLHTRDGLIALDPLRGSVLWTRSDLSARAEVFGDSGHVYIVDRRSDNTVTGGRALRAHDGVALDVPEFGALYERRLRTRGGQLLLTDESPTGVTLRLYDVLAGKDAWKRDFSPRAVIARSEDSDLVGVAEPSADGKFTVIDLRNQQEVLVTRVDDPKDVDKLQQAHLLEDPERFYLVPQRNEVQQNWSLWPNVMGGIRWLKVCGKVYAFEKTTGKRLWKFDTPGHVLIVDQFADVPVVLFAARFNKQLGPAAGVRGGGMQQVIGTKSIDKRTGKLLYDHESATNAQQFMALQVNPRAGTVDLISFNEKLHHFVERDAGQKADAGAGL
jgi:outer membrane protein assembly factor BamB